MPPKIEITVIVHSDEKKEYELRVGEHKLNLTQDEFPFLCDEVDAVRDETLSGELTRENLATIGAVVVESASLEYSIETLICSLLKLSLKQGAIFLSKGMFASKLETLKLAAEQQLADRPEILAELKDLISTMAANNTERTTVVHGMWSNIDASLSKGLLSLVFKDEYDAIKVARLTGATRTVSMEKVRALVQKLKTTERDLSKLHKMIRDTNS
jgi:hypothetical protein